MPSPDIYPRTDGMFQIGLDDETACGPVVRGGARRAGAAPLDGGPAMTSPVIIAKLINDDVAQAGAVSRPCSRCAAPCLRPAPIRTSSLYEAS